MAGYSQRREENYEVKHLKKVLMQVDRRVKLPEGLEASRLRRLIDGVEPATIREARLPRWLSLQSGIAYAAAFCLIVALVYSTEIYKPDLISGGLAIPEQAGAEAASPVSEPVENAEAAVADFADLEEPALRIVQAPEAAPEAPEPAAEFAASIEQAAPEKTGPAELGVGGSAKSELIAEYGEREYRWRRNDAADPDRTGDATLEVIDKISQELLFQVDIDEMHSVEHGFIAADALVLIGPGEDEAVLNVYTVDPEPVIQGSFTQPGELVDAKLHEDILHIATLSEPVVGEDAVRLPYSPEDGETCVITAVNLETLEVSQKAFAGVNGAVQLHNLNAYIRYDGPAEDGGEKNYIGQILLDGMDIELGTVS